MLTFTHEIIETTGVVETLQGTCVDKRTQKYWQ